MTDTTWRVAHRRRPHPSPVRMSTDTSTMYLKYILLWSEVFPVVQWQINIEIIL